MRFLLISVFIFAKALGLLLSWAQVTFVSHNKYWKKETVWRTHQQCISDVYQTLYGWHFFENVSFKRNIAGSRQSTDSVHKFNTITVLSLSRDFSDCDESFRVTRTTPLNLYRNNCKARGSNYQRQLWSHTPLIHHKCDTARPALLKSTSKQLFHHHKQLTASLPLVRCCCCCCFFISVQESPRDNGLGCTPVWWLLNVMVNLIANKSIV